MTNNRRHSISRTVALTGSLALSAFLLAAPAQAGSRHHGHGNNHGHGNSHHRGHDSRRYDDQRHHRYQPRGHHDYRGHDRQYDSRHHRYTVQPRFVVPSRLVHDHGHHYREFRHTRSYYRAHRHHHEVYYFPVRTGFGYAYRPHAYCEGRLFVGGSLSLRGSHFSLSFDF